MQRSRVHGLGFKVNSLESRQSYTWGFVGNYQWATRVIFALEGLFGLRYLRLYGLCYAAVPRCLKVRG